MWTKEYCGVQHLGKFNLLKTWVSVERHQSCAVLTEWFPGCRFHPKETDYKDVEAAKQAGELIMRER